jgi:hypothetical protein
LGLSPFSRTQTSGGVYEVGKYREVPFASSIVFDVNRDFTEKTTDGQFYVIAQEERKIRTNPAARVTDLLKEVFGRR